MHIYTYIALLCCKCILALKRSSYKCVCCIDYSRHRVRDAQSTSRDVVVHVARGAKPSLACFPFHRQAQLQDKYSQPSALPIAVSAQARASCCVSYRSIQSAFCGSRMITFECAATQAPDDVQPRAYWGGVSYR